MPIRSFFTGLFFVSLLFACSKSENETPQAAAAISTGQVTQAETKPAPVTTLKQGDGVVEAKSGDVVAVHYTGWVWDEAAAAHKGKQFDSSRNRGKPFVFTLGAWQVIKGWETGVTGMQVGEQRSLVIPPEAGYGARCVPGVIPPSATLLFEVELVKLGS